MAATAMGAGEYWATLIALIVLTVADTVLCTVNLYYYTDTYVLTTVPLAVDSDEQPPILPGALPGHLEDRTDTLRPSVRQHDRQPVSPPVLVARPAPPIACA